MTSPARTLPAPPTAMLRARAARVPSWAWTATGILTLAAFLWLAFGRGPIGYDTAYALLWGDQLAHGHLPDYTALHAPTPHPLANLAGLVLAPLGDHAVEGIALVSSLSLGALGWTAATLGRRTWSTAVGVLFAIVLLTRPLLVGQELIASIDVPYLALVLGAAAMVARRPDRGLPVLAVLGAAGLLRPEAWLLSGVYVLFLLRRSTPRRRAALIAAAAVAPAVWLVADAIVTGDALYSLHQASATAERTGETGGVVDTVVWAAKACKGFLHVPVAVVALAGVALALALQRRRAAVPLVLLALGTAGFVAVGFAGLPLLIRYFFLTATVLALFCAAALLGWRELEPGRPARRRWAILAAVLAVGLAVSLPYEVDRLTNQVDGANAAAARQDDMRTLVERPTVKALLLRCQPLQTYAFRARPYLVFLRRHDHPIDIVATKYLKPRDGLLLIRPGDPAMPVPSGFVPVASAGAWSLYERGCR
jgi:hypothetical protein